MSSINPSVLARTFHGKVAWVSGHTGFKGAWLSEWLTELGVKVYGFAQEPPTTPSLFEQLGLAQCMDHQIGDLRNPGEVSASILRAQPDFVFHLGAQPLVRLSFEQPVETYATNVGGTIHVLEALRRLDKPCAAVLITSDKCYENREWLYGYREDDPLGGYDPYSSSKAAMEIAVASWRRSFFQNHPVRIATARAGNVIGGGDWAADRILPDCIRALSASRTITVRNQTATRPWQHVLEPLSGYLWLGAVLSEPALRPNRTGDFESAFNFGPGPDSNRTVRELVTEVLQHWPGHWKDSSDLAAVHEANLLHLAIDKAHHLLGWKPVMSFAKTVEITVSWYRKAHGFAGGGCATREIVELTKRQIREFETTARECGAAWAAQ